jgi:PAS domain S-box-containing protein
VAVNALLSSMNRDVTNRKRAEERIRQNEELFRVALNDTPVIVGSLDRDLRFIWAYNLQSGYTAEALIGNPFGTGMQFDDMEGILRRLKDVVEQGKPTRFQVRGICPAGERVFDFYVEPRRKESSEIEGAVFTALNITEIKRSQEALQKEKGILQQVMNGAKNMHLVYLDRDFNFVRVNEAYAKTCGYKPEEMIGKNHFALYPGEEIEAIFKRVRDTGEAAQFHDKPFVFPDQPQRGVTYWDWTLKPVKNEAGEVEGLVLSLVETTERKKAEEEIRNLAKFPSENPSPVLRIDKNGYFLYCNYAAKQSLKATKCDIGEVIPDGWRVFVDAAFASGERQEFEEQIGGRTFAFALSPVSDYVNVYGHDITERKKVEETLLESERKYRRLYETSQDGIMARDLKGRIINCNRAYSRMLGYSKRELRTLPVYRLLPEKWRRHRDELYMQIVETGASKVFEREYIRKDGSVFPASVRSWPLTDDSGKVVGVWSVVRDISELKKTEEELRRAEWVSRHRAEELEIIKTKLEEKAAKVEEYATHMEELAEERALKLKDAERLAAIGATAAMVGHDIRNPLQAISGDLYLAMSELIDLPENEQKASIRESLKSIDESVDYINKIVADLQDFAKPIKPNAQETDVESLIEEVLFKDDVPDNVNLSCQVEGGAEKVITDGDLLKRVLSNLVSNAFQAMPNGGELAIHARREGDDIVVSVEDTGVGIPEEVKPKLFSPLFTTKSRGQGFGLPVVKRITEALGGTVAFESEVGKGTKFIVRLPPKS